MGRVFRGYLLGAGAACALAVLPATALASPSPSTVTKRVSVSASGVSSAKLTCPHKGVALSGYVSALSGGAVSRDSLPGADIHSWSFNFTSGGGAGHARVGLRCLRLKLPKGIKQVRTKVFTTKSVIHPGAGSSAIARASCSKGYLPTGYGVDRSNATAAAGQLPLTSAIPRSRAWDFRVRNTSASTQSVTVHLRCLGSHAVASGGGRKLSEHFKLRTKSGAAKLSTGSLTLKCSPGYYSLAAGHTVPATDDMFVTADAPSGARGGRFGFSNPSGGKQQVHTYLTCLSLNSSFR